MPYCPKCGSEITDEMVFCPKCGVSLKPAQPEDWREQMRQARRDWRDKRRDMRSQMRETRRGEKEEEWEKTEKHEVIFIGPFVAGLIVLLFGVLLYFVITSGFDFAILGPLFLVFVGAVIIAAAIYGAVVFARRHPRPPPTQPGQ